MDSRRALLADVFTTESLSGSAVGVVSDVDGLDAEQMCALAVKLDASGTAFVCSSAAVDCCIRYLTPQQEVDLYGYATIAAHAHLAAERDLEPDTHALGTNVGTLDIELGDLGEVWMTQDAPMVRSLETDYDHLVAAFDVDDAALRDVDVDLPVAVAFIRLPFLVVPVNFLGYPLATDPDGATIVNLAAEHDAAGFYAYTFDAIDGDSTFYARCFAPDVGISEDPMAETAAGVCGAYLRQVGAFDSTPDELRFEQGHFVNRPGTVRVQVGAEIRVGSRAVQPFDGEIVVPEFADGDIIEA